MVSCVKKQVEIPVCTPSSVFYSRLLSPLIDVLLIPTSTALMQTQAANSFGFPAMAVFVLVVMNQQTNTTTNFNASHYFLSPHILKVCCGTAVEGKLKRGLKCCSCMSLLLLRQ